MSDFDFLLRPTGSIFLGQPAPFSAGEAHSSWSQFPPSPRTFQGMVRSHLLRTAEPALDLDDWSTAARRERVALVGGPEGLPEGWQLHGPWPVRVQGEGLDAVGMPWFPLPCMVAPTGRREDQRLARLGLVTGGLDWLSDTDDGAARLGIPGSTWGEPATQWISAHNLVTLLTAAGTWDPSGYAERLPPFVAWEPHTGLALEAGPKTAQDGMLYTRGHLRFEVDGGLAGRLSIRGAWGRQIDPTRLTSGVARLGRGGAPVALEPCPDPDPQWRRFLAEVRHVPDRVAEEDAFWLVALSPFALEVGRDGQALSDPLAALMPRLEDCELIRVATMPGRSTTLGGFDLAAGRARENRTYLPAGTAFLIRLRGGTPESRAAVLHRLHDGHHLGPVAERAFGFGHIVVSAPTSRLAQHELQGRAA